METTVILICDRATGKPIRKGTWNASKEETFNKGGKRLKSHNVKSKKQ